MRRWDKCLPSPSPSEADRLSEMSVEVEVEVVDIDIVSDVAEALLCMRFCCARLTVGDKSFTYGKVAGAGGGANVGIGGGGGVPPTARVTNGGGDGEFSRLEESGDISEPSGPVMITS